MKSSEKFRRLLYPTTTKIIKNFPVYTKKLLLLWVLLWVSTASLHAQKSPVYDVVNNYLRSYKLSGYQPRDRMGMDSLRTDDNLREVRIYANEPFCSQPFTPQSVSSIYTDLQRRLPAPYNTYRLSIYNKKQQLIEDLVPNIYRTGGEDASRLWGKINYQGKPWVENTSRPYKVTEGLQNRHLFIWPSHGRYYKEGAWQWQRPYLFCTTEDLFTQSFVLPYLFPMLENAGAIVACPRERDYQTHEAVIDNDTPNRQGHYAETTQADAQWQASADSTGFASTGALLNDAVHPFQSGTYRSITAVNRRTQLANATWTPNIPAAGRYAVYVSYATRPNSVPDAHYTVIHKGGRTNFTVNQQMGGGTWVYLGTFDFAQGTEGRVVLTNQSDHRGIITADAVRFGGGVGQTERGTAGTSGLPRYLEAARYYAQWAGIPDSLVNTTASTNDYADDLRVRGNMLNYLAAGSPYVPNKSGQKVPFELSLAIHSDAGVHTDQSIYGSLAISTTQDGEGNTNYISGLSRQASSDFAQLLLQTLTTDVRNTFKVDWTRREHWDRNYAETRMPDVPSAILETMSHQNFADMRYGHDPLFKFTLARAVYKSILRFVNYEHGIKQYTVQPLAPHAFSAQLSADASQVRLTWRPTTDSLETTAVPTGYIIYTRVDNEAFDNGLPVGNVTEYTLPISAGRTYTFRVTAVNAGGESFPTEQLCAYRSEQANAPRVLIVNAFDRLSGPAMVNTPDSLGFRIDLDPGVPYISTTAYSGEQRVFTPSTAGSEGSHALGYSAHNWVGREIAGNTFDYAVCHGHAIASTGAYSFCSVSREVFESPAFSTHGYVMVDYIAGLQAQLPYNLRPFPVFTSAARNKLNAYLKEGGSLFLSGSYVGSDNVHSAADRDFIEDMLKFKYDGSARIDSTDIVNGLNMQFSIYRKPNAVHYATIAPDAILPASNKAFTAFAYGGGQGAGVAYQGKTYRTLSISFPFECIRDKDVRNQAMKAILGFLVKR